jgi:signal transduction histidine kinase
MAVNTIGRVKDLPPLIRDALEMIRRNVQVEAHFIDDLLDLTKISRGKLELVREPMDLHETISRAVEVSASDMESKKQQLTLDLEAGIAQLEGDQMRLQQAFWNLLKNASKFTPERGQIHITSRNQEDRIIVEVSDTGVGFPPEKAEAIFDPFAQASVAVTREFGGLGLGLAISKAAIEAHGGALRAHSEGANRGAIFTVELPLQSEDERTKLSTGDLDR